jgi:hypothetical protein
MSRIFSFTFLVLISLLSPISNPLFGNRLFSETPSADQNYINTLSQVQEEEQINYFDRYVLELRIANYSFDDTHIKNLFEKKKIDYSIELSQSLSKYAEGWFGLGWMQKKGRMLASESEVAISLMPISGGIKLVICPSEKLDTYVGAGFNFLQI